MVEINSSDIFSLEQINKNIKVFAGPGAGKTHFLVENVKNIIKKMRILLMVVRAKYYVLLILMLQ